MDARKVAAEASVDWGTEHLAASTKAATTPSALTTSVASAANSGAVLARLMVASPSKNQRPVEVAR